MPRRRLLFGVVMAAALLVVGRALSAAYADYAWYRAMGATALWSERFTDVLIIYSLGVGISFAIALANFSTLARSIGALTLPRRLANVEFGEAVPRRYLDRFALGLSLAVAAAMIPLFPQWTALAVLRQSVSFQERDPYFHHDLAFYTTWLPFEKSLYTWVMVLIVTVALIVVGLYSLTPGLRWERAGLRMSTLVRKHLSVLAAVILLLTMWSYRIASYDLLIQTGGESGSFSYVEHQWLLPGLLILSIVTAAAAATMLFSGWSGQLRTSFIAVTAVVMLSVTVQEVVPLIVERFTPPEALAASERPYTGMRTEFTKRAYDIPLVPREVAAPGGSAQDSAADVGDDQPALLQDSLVYPGATGLLVISEPQLDVAGHRVGQGLPRLAFAWAYRSLGLLADSIPPRARIVTVRDVRRRVAALAPVFTQGNTATPLFHADTLYWKLELYSASSDYPLSEARTIAGAERNYFRHAATALVNGRTARVSFAAVTNPDPLARAWIRSFPHASDYRATAVARRLTAAPWDPAGAATGSPASDSTFRADVTRVYNLMRAALAAGNLAAFSAAYDSLGALLGASR